MATARASVRSRRRAKDAGHDNSERWLLTYADKITLLLALFMVLFSISSVNISKYRQVQKSLKAAFSGNILPGGKSIAQQGATANQSHAPTSSELQALAPLPATASGLQSESRAAHGSTGAIAASLQQEGEFVRIKHELDAYAAAHGFASKVHTAIEARGLVIRVLTDDLLFESGQAALDSRAGPLLGEIAQLLGVDQTHRVDVEGNTDDVPISGPYPSNWELSTARASTVVRYLIEHGVGAARLTAAGYADQRPIASNATAAGRALNRRVEIVMQRQNGGEGEA